MNEPSSSSPLGTLKKIEWTPQRIKLAVVFGLVLVVYLLLRPWLQSALGIPLPGLFPDKPAAQVDAPAQPEGETKGNGSLADADSSGPKNPMEEAGLPTTDRSTTGKSTTGKSTTTTPSSTSPKTTTKPATTPKTIPQPKTTTTPKTTTPPKTTTSPSTTPKPSTTTPSTGPKPATPVKPQPALGVLTDIGGKSLKSTAGLIYRPTRYEHRVEHVLLHADDNPDKPVHGVYNGTREEILALIDEAYLLAQKARPPTVTVEEQNDRTVYTVDMGHKIGYMGGQSGKRKKFPACRHVQLVLEGNEVITAYPVIP
ncbi:MAG: hypothetical protein R3C01_01415 [Planctomycetaceae bacterium]